jgi:hypothetical protein
MDRNGVHLRLVGQAFCQRLPGLIAAGLAKDAAASSGCQTHRTRVDLSAIMPSSPRLRLYRIIRLSLAFSQSFTDGTDATEFRDEACILKVNTLRLGNDQFS